MQKQNRRDQRPGREFSWETDPPALVSPSNSPDPQTRPSAPSLARGGDPGIWQDWKGASLPSSSAAVASRPPADRGTSDGFLWARCRHRKVLLSSLTQGGVIVFILHTRKPRNRGQVTLLLLSEWQQPNTRALNHGKSLLSGKTQDWKSQSFIVVEGYLD